MLPFIFLTVLVLAVSLCCLPSLASGHPQLASPTPALMVCANCSAFAGQASLLERQVCKLEQFISANVDVTATQASFSPRLDSRPVSGSASIASSADQEEKPTSCVAWSAVNPPDCNLCSLCFSILQFYCSYVCLLCTYVSSSSSVALPEVSRKCFLGIFVLSKPRPLVRIIQKQRVKFVI